MVLQGFYLSGTKQISTQVLTAAFKSPAEVHGCAQFAPRSRFLGDHVAILNLRLKSLDVDTGDIGRLLGGFAGAFFGGTNRSLLISKHVEFDLDLDMSAHAEQMNRIARTLRAVRCALASRWSS
jgi:hypothetical protein